MKNAPLTFKNFFTDLIFHPQHAKQKDRGKCIALSIALGIFSLGIIPAIVGISWGIDRIIKWRRNDLSLHEQKIQRAAQQIFQPGGSSSQEKRRVINNLPLWFAGHFPDSQQKELLDLFPLWNIDLEGKTDEEVGLLFGQIQNVIYDDLTDKYSKLGITLRGLTIPKTDPYLAAVVSDLMSKVWKSTLLNELRYPECNTGMMTYDSRAILLKEIEKNGVQMSPEKREFWTNEAENSTLRTKLHMGIGRPVFTIGVRLK